MKRAAFLFVALSIVLASPCVVAGETKKAGGASTPVMPANAALAPVIATAERFAAALKAADFTTLSTLLDERVLILESGGAERSRAEYFGHHAIADAAFLGGATVKVGERQGDVQGDTAWLATESEITPAAGKPVLSTETLVFRRIGGDWRIVHVHWSSRPKKVAP